MYDFTLSFRRRRPARTAMVLFSAAMLALAGCESDPSVPDSVIASVAVTPRLSNLVVGGTQQLAASALDASGNPVAGATVTWTSSEPSVATVSATGLVTTVGAGSTAIQASSENATGFASITVTAPVAAVLVTGNSGVVPVGQTLQLSAQARDAAGNSLFLRPVTWASSAPTVATVSSSGLVTAVSAGSATITATSEGRTGSTTITTAVLAAPVATVTVAPASAQLILGTTQQLTATLRDGTGLVLLDRAVTWNSSNTALATVSSNGLVTTLAAGAVTITANSEGRSGSAVLTALPGLANNAPETIAAAINSSLFYYVSVPAGTTRLVITTTGGSGDPDLYAYRPVATPTTPGTAVCSSESDGPVETCTINAPAAGLWLVEVFAYAAFSGVQIRAAITP